MSTFSPRLFDTAIPGLDEAFFAPVMQSAKTARKAPVKIAPPVSVSLWRHTLDEHAARRHGFATRVAFGMIAALSIGSTAYALWQTCGLMSGNSLLDAVAVFLR